MEYGSLSHKQILQHFKTSDRGLTNKEASKRLQQWGVNELSSHDRWAWLKRLVEPFKSAFVMVLVAGAVISSLTGNQTDTIVILAVVVINAIIEWAQAFSAARILASLKRYSAKHVKVRREQRVVTLESTQIVPGDIVLIGQGEKVPADGRLLEATDLSVDESSLTGESLPVQKTQAQLRGKRPLYQQHNMVFNGSLLLTGRGEMCVTATGNHTQLGKIAALATQEETQAPIYKKIKKLTFQLVVATLLIGAAVIILGLLRGYSLFEMLRFAVALIVSVIPEGLPVTLTIILLLGLKRMAKNKAFVRNLPAVETLGMVTVIATDKTGTLTKSNLGIGEVWDLDGSLSKEDKVDFWLSVSHRHPDLQHPIERIITEFSESKGAVAGWQELADVPFETDRRYTLVLWKRGRSLCVYIKGAPEDVLDACKMTKVEQTKVSDSLKRMTGSGMRVIAVAKKTLEHTPAHLNKTRLSRFAFAGLIGFADELRPEAKAALAETKAAGVTVFMLTGDHLNTARTVAQQVGLAKAADEVTEGSVLEAASDNQVKRLLRKVRVFARVLPEHKYKLLQSLRQTDITAMTGDGVNDAPALAQADVGIAMGSGTDAAKEAADMVLLDDNYATIVKAIAAGRTIYANIRKMVFYLLSTNLAEALTIVAGLLLGLPLALTAAQVLWLNLVTDTLMVIPLGIEPAEPGQMHRPPRNPHESLLSSHLVGRLVFSTLVMAGVSVLLFWYFLPQGLAFAQTMAFLSLVLVQWVSAFNIRSELNPVWKSFKRPNWSLFIGIALGAVLMALVIYGPLNRYLGTQPIPAHYYWYLLPSIILTLATTELHKYWLRRQK